MTTIAELQEALTTVQARCDALERWKRETEQRLLDAIDEDEMLVLMAQLWVADLKGEPLSGDKGELRRLERLVNGQLRRLERLANGR